MSPFSEPARFLALGALCLVVLAGSLAADAKGRGALRGERFGTVLERHELRRTDAARAIRRAHELRPTEWQVSGAPLSPRARSALTALSPGDLISSVGADGEALRIVLRPKTARVTREPLSQTFVSRGIAHDPASGRVAIAAVSRVLVYDPAALTVMILEEIVEGEPFRFANDVVFDEDGLLIIADQGESTGGKEPADGRLWEYDLAAGDGRRIARARRLSNPAFLALDSRGRIHVVDLEAGPLVTPLLTARWDAVFRVRGAKRKGARPVFKEPGVQATAFDMGPDDRMWFGSFSELAIVDGKTVSQPCPILALPFEFATGIVVTSESLALVSDGADAVTGNRFIREVDESCASTIRTKGKRIAGVRGLAMVPEDESTEP